MGQIKVKMRENQMVVVSGCKGVGKSYTTFFEEILPYYSGLLTGKKSKVLILDINDEYGEMYPEAPEHVRRYGSRSIMVKPIGLEQLAAFTASQVPDVRRVRPVFTANKYNEKGKLEAKKGDAMEPDDMVGAAVKCFDDFHGGLLLLEDISMLFGNAIPKSIAGRITRIRHLNLDLIMHVQSIGVIVPRMWQNVNAIRFHNQLDTVPKSEGKLMDRYDLFQLAEFIVKARYNAGDNRYYLYIDNLTAKVRGEFTREEAVAAARRLVVQTNYGYRGQSEAEKVSDIMRDYFEF
jgi:hypothetical protein